MTQNLVWTFKVVSSRLILTNYGGRLSCHQHVNISDQSELSTIGGGAMKCNIGIHVHTVIKKVAFCLSSTIVMSTILLFIARYLLMNGIPS